MKIEAATLDDVLRKALEMVMQTGRVVSSSRDRNGKIKEIIAVQIALTNPRARLSFAEGRATLFSCFGEFLWYLSRKNDIDFIEYYIPKYRKDVDVQDGAVPAGYGYRLFNWQGQNQIDDVITALRKTPESKKATIQLFDRTDISSGRSDIPCTCTLQFLQREKKLHLIAHMRSNDVFKGLPHDIFAFTMIQELVACSIGAELGEYHHWTGSLHVYSTDEGRAKNILHEGWQQTVGASMPPMPLGDPWATIQKVMEAETAFRVDGRMERWPTVGNQYWDNVIGLLEFKRHKKKNSMQKARAVADRLRSTFYEPLLNDRAKSDTNAGKAT